MGCVNPLLYMGNRTAIIGLFDPFPRNKILDQTKLKAFADDKLNVTKINNFCLLIV